MHIQGFKYVILDLNYSKSGNTYLRTLLSAYYYSKDGIFFDNLIKNIGQFPEKRHFEGFKYNINLNLLTRLFLD